MRPFRTSNLYGHWQAVDEEKHHKESDWEDYWDNLHQDDFEIVYESNVDCLYCMIVNIRRWAWVLNKMGY